MKKYLSILFTLFLVVSVHAQSADVITDILETDKVTFGQVCYISAVEQGLIDEKDDYNKAVEALVANELIPEYVDSSIQIPLGDAIFIVAHIWEIKGGLMYRLTKGSPRYCFKQFKSDGIIKQNAEPEDIISGPDLLNIYNKCNNIYGGFSLRDVSMEIE